MNWTLDQLQAFITTVEQGSFSAAARRLGKAQSRVSSAVANFELDLGFALFDREGRYPQLTAKGKGIYHQSRQILEQCQQMQSKVKTLNSGEEGELRLAMDEAVPVKTMEEVLFCLSERFPLLNLTVVTGIQGDVTTQVSEGAVDIGLLFRTQISDEPLEWRRLGLCHQSLVVASDHPLVDKPSVSLSDLRAYRQIVMCNRQGQAFSTPISANCWYSDNYYFAAGMVARGRGWSLLPEHIVTDDWFQQGLSQLHFDGFNEPMQYDLAAVRRRDSVLGPVSQWLLEEIERAFAQ